MTNAMRWTPDPAATQTPYRPPLPYKPSGFICRYCDADIDLDDGELSWRDQMPAGVGGAGVWCDSERNQGTDHRP